jgi:hypothetical protein
MNVFRNLNPNFNGTVGIINGIETSLAKEVSAANSAAWITWAEAKAA